MTDPEQFDAAADRAYREGMRPVALLELYIDSEADRDPVRAHQLELRLEAIRTQALVDIAGELHGLVVGLATIVTEAPGILAAGLTAWLGPNASHLSISWPGLWHALTELERQVHELKRDAPTR